MAEFAERYSGEWKGRNVSFKRVFRGRRLSDAECKKLCDGMEIEIRDLEGKSGKYSIVAALDNLEYNGHKYVGVKQLRFVGGIPKKWCEHVFTDDEKALLEAGKRLELTGCVSKKGNVFDVAVTWEQKDDGTMALIPHFDD